MRRIDPFGSLVWENLISEDDDVFIFSVATDSTGRIGVAGRIGSGGNANAFVGTYTSAGAQEWSDTFGDPLANDEAHGIAFDASGRVYVGGRTSGSLTGAGSFGDQDGFLRKYDADGSHLWTEQLGTSERDVVFGVATDSADHALVTGVTSGDLEGSLIGDSQDGFLRKYNPTGVIAWTRQFGSAGNSTEGVSVAATADDDVLVGGRVNATAGQFVSKYDSLGTTQWTVSVSPQPFDHDVAVAGDADGDAYLAGMTFLGAAFGPDIANGEAGTDDAYIQQRLALNGALDWSVRLSSQDDGGLPVSFDRSLAIATFGAGNVYVAGETSGSFEDIGSGNGFIARLASDVAVADIANDVTAAPADAFKSPGHANAILARLAEIEEGIETGDIHGATSKLMALRARVNGCEDSPSADANDWIVDCDVQNVIRILIDALLANLS